MATGENGLLYISTDGISWSKKYSGKLETLSSIAYGLNRYVTVGQFGAISSFEDFTIQSRGKLHENYIAINDNDEQIIALEQSGKTFISSDCNNWTKKQTGSVVVYRGLAFGNGKFIAACYYDRFASISYDGNNWENQIASSLNYIIHSISFCKDEFIVTGENGRLVRSPDGLLWSEIKQDITRKHLISIAYGACNYIVVGDNGTILKSRVLNDNNWEIIKSNVSNTLRSVIYADNQFIAIGDSGYISSSRDGIVWKKTPSITKEQLNAVAYGDNHFVAVGSNGIILSSKDGAIWVVNSSCTNSYLNSITYFKEHFFAAGDNETIIVSKPAKSVKK